MNVATSRFRIIILLALLLISACARLPEYARPHFRPVAEGTAAPPNGFTYRQLTPEDFQAPSLTEDVQRYNHSIQARSCISIRPARNTTIRISRGNIANTRIYTGRYVDISFKALFNPDCSWWNPKAPPKQKDYILEHEQIHFALTELSARRLNRQYRQSLLDYIAVGSTAEEIRAELVEKAKKVLRQGMQNDLQMHTRFDEDTSMFYDREKQQEWLNRVIRELEEEEGKTAE
jgi:hypothetical protein